MLCSLVRAEYLLAADCMQSHGEVAQATRYAPYNVRSIKHGLSLMTNIVGLH